MGIFDRLFKKTPKDARWAPTLNGFSPVYTQFGTNIYASDVVVQALKCIVDEMKKLKPMHVRTMENGDPVPVKGSIQDILTEPNPIMTSSEMIEKTCWLLLMNYNAFLIPTYQTWTDEKTGAERRTYKSLYPIQPEQVDFLEDGADDLYVRFTFGTGYQTTLRYSDVIHIKYNYSINQYMGGDRSGQPDHSALLKTLDLNKQMLEGVAKAMKASYAINGVIKYNTLMDDGKTEAALAELEKKLMNNESGFLPIDLKSEFTPLPHTSSIVDANMAKFLDEKILRNFGVPIPILTGDFTTEQLAAFYQKTLEPLIVSFSQAFTKKLFTPRERAFGNQIKFYPKDLIFMSTQQTLEMINILAPTGAMYENEKRVALGLRPIPELEGKRYMSLNWVDAANAAQYQIGKNATVDVVDEEKEEI